MPLPSPERIEEASRLIDSVFLDTPQFELDALNDQLGFRLVCKVESLNPIRSFKGRGADYFLHDQSGDEGALVCASAGNFGQGLAYAARKRGIGLTVFAAENANPLKLERMRRLGAELRLAGQDLDAAKDAARMYAETEGRRFVEDGREPAITEGAGTIALELTRDPEPFDAVLVPLGNGALINGIGTWFKMHSPETEVVGVVAAGAPAMANSWRSQSLETTARVDTIADGIAVRVPIPEALEVMRYTVDDVLHIEDEAILAALQLAHETLGLVLEPAGAVGLAAAMAYRERFSEKRVATPLCGGNLTAAQLKRWL